MSTRQNQSTIRELYTKTFPLGPAIAEGIRDTTRLSLLFDEKSKLVSKLNHDKSLIIGRKGSGKTTLLESVQILNKNAEAIYLEPSDAFTRIVKEVNELSAIHGKGGKAVKAGSYGGGAKYFS